MDGRRHRVGSGEGFPVSNRGRGRLGVHPQQGSPQKLGRERQRYESNEQSRASLTRDNYAFGVAVDDEEGGTIVPIAARRRDDLLIDGMLVLDAEGDLRRMEGRLIKNPSFWTRRVDIVRQYGRINGVRVLLAVSSTAQVRIVGTSTFSMCVEYELVNGDVVDRTESR